MQMLDINLNDGRNRTDGAERAPAILGRRPHVRRAASRVAIGGVGLAIGIAFGTIAAVMLGLVALC